MADWFDTGGNIRQMHSTSLPPAGKGVSLESSADGEFVRSKVVEPVAVRLVDEGVYQGYSVGISRAKVVRDIKAPGGRIVGGRIIEVSLVDRPANPVAKFQLVKAAASDGHALFTGKVIAANVPPQDFAGPRRSFPIAEPGDVSDAWSLSGHAKNPDGVRSRIRAIARRKGPEYVAALPDDSPAQKALLAKGGFTHTHTHFGPGNTPHKHEHTHGPVTPDHSELHEGGSHAHSHAAEVSVADAQQAPDDGGTSDTDNRPNAAQSDVAPPDSTGPVKPDDAAGGDAAAGDAPASHDDPAATGAPAGPPADANAPAVDAAAAKPAKDGKKPNPFAKQAKKEAKAAKKAAAKAASSLGVTKKADDDEPVPYVVRRAHDLTCAAYKMEDVLAFYPSIQKDGVAAALGENTRKAIYAMLAQEVAEDAGSGTEAEDICCLSDAYKHMTEFLTVEGTEGADADDAGAAVGAPDETLFMSAHAELHSAFKSMNAAILGQDLLALPSPADSISPGQFKRPYLSDGHQREIAGRTTVSVMADAHPIDPDTYSRGPITEGHARTLTDKVSGFHDALTAWKPEICRMESGRFDSDRQADKPTTATVPNGDSAKPATKSLPATAMAPGEKAATGSMKKMLRGDAFKTAVAEATALTVKTAMAEHIDTIERLRAEVEALAAAPDPSRSALRGVTGSGVRVDKVSHAAEVQHEAEQRRKSVKKTEEISYLQSIVRTGAPEARIAAEDRLARLGIN